MKSLSLLATEKILAQPPQSLRSLPRNLRSPINQIRFDSQPPSKKSLWSTVGKVLLGPDETLFEFGNNILYQGDLSDLGVIIGKIPLVSWTGRKRESGKYRGFLHRSNDVRLKISYVSINYHGFGCGAQMLVETHPEPHVYRRLQALLIPLIRPHCERRFRNEQVRYYKDQGVKGRLVRVKGDDDGNLITRYR